MQVEARYSRSRSLLLFVIGLVAIVYNATLYAPGLFDDVLRASGAFLVLAGLRGVDRRVKLRVGPEGLWFAPWGHTAVPSTTCAAEPPRMTPRCHPWRHIATYGSRPITAGVATTGAVGIAERSRRLELE
jgi:hypothetical protein